MDLSALPHREKGSHGGVWGDAYLTGTVVDGILHVITQGRPRPITPVPILTVPPCPPPPGGWKMRSDSYEFAAAYAYARRNPEEVVSIFEFYPGPHTPVVTVASTDSTRTMSALAKAYPRSLCIVPSRYTRADVHHAAAVAHRLSSPETTPSYLVDDVSTKTGPDGQPYVEVVVVYDDPAVRQALASLPAGLIKIVTWLQPVSG